jgi:hypothetical protein
LTATFTPVAKGTFTETMSLVTNAADAATSGALLTGTGVFLEPTSLVIAVTSPTTATMNYAQAVTLSITVTPTANVGAIPTGTVKITVNGKLQTQTLPASGVVTVTLNPAVGVHAISASYSGDTSYASSSSSFSFMVLKAVTITTLGLAVGQQGSVPALTFTATVSSTTASGETGTVSFYAGTALIGTGTVNTAGVATLTTQTTVFATYSFTAVYPGDTNFAASTSAAVVPSPNFTVVPASTTVTVPQGGVATLTSSITPLYNYSGTLTASRSGLPTDIICRFSPTSLSLSGTVVQTFNVYIYTSVNPTLASVEMPSGGGTNFARIVAWPLAAVMMMLLGRRRLLASRIRLISLLTFALMLGGLSGCSNTNAPAASSFVTPTGTSAISVTYVDGNAVTHTVNYSLTVVAPYTLP